MASSAASAPTPHGPEARAGALATSGDRVRGLLGRRWPEALAWGFGVFLAAGIPGIYCWIVVSAAVLDILQATVGGGQSTQDWSALAVHLPIGAALGIAAWIIAAAVCAAIARGRRLHLTPMLAVGWIAYVAPFALWLGLLRP